MGGNSFTYGLIEKREAQAAARIYLQSFPHRFRQWFRSERAAARFYEDLMELMRLAHSDTFFAARDGDQLVGYLILTRPGVSLFRAIWREGLFLRILAHVLSGHYGFSVSLPAQVLRSLFAVRTPLDARLAEAPHVYVVVVRPEYAGKGIGSSLIEQARAACAERYSRMWLRVEVENTNAIRLYERIGFRIVRSDPVQHVMVWEFQESEGAAQTR